MIQFRSLLILLGFFLVSACTTPTSVTQKEVPLATPREPALFGFGEKTQLDEAEIRKNSSSDFLGVSKARVILDNDAAFDAKVEAVKSAKAGETIRMSYYIYSDDYSSSIFTSEVLKAAKRGVNVRIMADAINNYWLLDYFNYLESQGDGRIKVRFFGRPTAKIIRDVVFLTRPCPDTPTDPTSTYCSDFKWKNYDGTRPDFFAQLLLSAMYSKKAGAVKTAVLMGQQIDLGALQSGASASPEDKKQLLEFFKLVYRSKLRHDPIAAIKVAIAVGLYGEKLNPVLNNIYGHIPLQQMGESSLKDWEHSTDFTHHKILLIGNRYLQLGGRNIEDSYHMKQNPLTKKYIFVDTDFAAEINRGGERIAQAYDELYNFEPMTFSLKEIRQLMPNDFVMNPEAAEAAVEKCTPSKYTTVQQRENFATCVQQEMTKHGQYKNLEERMTLVASRLAKNAETYRSQYLPNKRISQTWRKGSDFSDTMDSQDASQMLLTYIENTPYSRAVEPSRRVRQYGASVGSEDTQSKAIHELWIRGLQNTCAVAAEELKKNPKAPKKRVIFNTAYYLPPTNVIQAMTKMMNGTWDCSNVRVTLLTNSFETTDLNAINVLARYQMLAFFEVYWRRESFFGPYGARRAATFDYYEYKKMTTGSGMSLHTKLMIMGDDVIIGSANADVRSYYMDTNNGVFMRNAPGFVRDYTSYVDGLLANPDKVRNLTPLYLSTKLNLKMIQKEDAALIDSLLKRFKLDTKNPELKERAHELGIDLGNYIYSSTQKLVAPKKYLVPEINNSNHGGSGNVDAQINSKQQDIADQFNRLLQLF